MPKRIAIIGCSGSGKTTLGRQLAQRLEIPFTDLDDLHWLPDWTERCREEMRKDVEKVVAQEEWVIVGNYSSFRDLIWTQASLIIWLDLPLRVCLWRGFRRALRNIWHGRELCNGNYDSWGRLLSWGPTSIIWWIISSYPGKKKRYSRLLIEEKEESLPPHVRLTSGKSIEDPLLLEALTRL